MPCGVVGCEARVPSPHRQNAIRQSAIGPGAHRTGLADLPTDRRKFALLIDLYSRFRKAMRTFDYDPPVASQARGLPCHCFPADRFIAVSWGAMIGAQSTLNVTSMLPRVALE